MGEEHDSESRSNGSRGEVFSESSQNSTVVSVAGGNAAPNSFESVLSFAGVFFEDICHSLSEIILSADAIVDSLKFKDTLVEVLLNFGS